MNEKLAIFLITYNRKQYLKRTLDQILAEDSPVRGMSITILDNASTDGTSEMIDCYCKQYNNICHIRHIVNIGGNANICRAYELGFSSGKDYVWVIADDDVYDFTNWNLVEEAAKENADIICVADYAFPDVNKRESVPHQILQLTFVPAGIYKTSFITDSVLMAMYDAIYTMFSQSCLAIYVINNNLKIHVCNKPIVFNGLHFEDHTSNNSYTRGASHNFILHRRRDTTWLLGYANVLSLLNNSDLQSLCIDAAIHFKDIFKNESDFFSYLYHLKNVAPNYYMEIYQVLPLAYKRKIKLRSIVAFFQCYFDIRNEYIRGEKIKVFTFLGLKYKRKWHH